jgi:predicted nucleic acid-binding protein
VTLYLDTSVIVKLYIREDDSEEVLAAVADAAMVATSWLAYPEACAAFERRRRERSVGPAALKAARQAFAADWSSWIAVGLDADLVRHSARLAEQYGLRAADALHLASFERILAACEDDDVRFLCANARLSKAARNLG